MIYFTYAIYLVGHILRTEKTGMTTIQNENFDEPDIREII